MGDALIGLHNFRNGITLNQSRLCEDKAYANWYLKLKSKKNQKGGIRISLMSKAIT
jgi:hypothetical protein